MDPFESIYLEYSDGIYRFLYKLSSDPELSEELTQECFYQAFRGFSRYRGNCELFTWLCAIAKNLYFSYLRRHKTAAFNDSLLLEEEDPDPLPEEKVLKTQREQAVQKAINNLPKKYRDVVLLRIYADLPFEQIAAHLGISENSAKVLFFRAKAKLKEDLSHVCL